MTILSTGLEKASPYLTYYHNATENHFWIEWRFQVFWQQVRKLRLSGNAPLKGLDVGCGNGVVRRQIEHHTLWTTDGADIIKEALHLNTTQRGQTFLYDITERHADLQETYDFIILFDVLEHIHRPKPFLEAVLSHVKPSGWLFINVPALMILFSQYDRVQNHFRRYDRAMIRQDLNLNALTIQDIRYWGFALLPLGFLRKFCTRKNASPQLILERGFKMPHNWLNSLFRGIMHVETSCLRRPIVGTSLMIAARKIP